MNPTHLDVLIVGAGLSGIGAAYHLQTRCPAKTYAILEARERLGGTWDLFRYPGIRSDSDMYTLGYSFRPWTNPKAIADGPSILAYLRETAEAYGIDRQHPLRPPRRARALVERGRALDGRGARRRVGRAACGSRAASSSCAPATTTTTRATRPTSPARERFRGRIVHPQQWPADLDYAGKRVVVIGSGATAVTLVPALAKRAAHVTMLQRSPTYIVSVPERDPIADWLRARLPRRHGLRDRALEERGARHGVLQLLPPLPGARASDSSSARCGGSSAARSTSRRTSPRRTGPWDQRLCLVPDGDLFAAIREGRASVVTDHIETFTETGIALRSGQSARGRPHRHGDGAQAEVPRRHRSSRSTASASSRRRR